MSPNYPSTDSQVGTTRRRTFEDKETIPSRHSTIPNGDSVVGTEGADVKPGSFVLSNAAQLPITKGLGKRGLKKRRVVNNDDLEVKGPPTVTKSRKDKKILKIKPKLPPVVKFELPEKIIRTSRAEVESTSNTGTRSRRNLKISESEENSSKSKVNFY